MGWLSVPLIKTFPLSSCSAPPFTSSLEIAEASQGVSKGRRHVMIYKACKAVDPLSPKTTGNTIQVLEKVSVSCHVCASAKDVMSGKRGYITSKNLHHLTTSLLKNYKLETKKTLNQIPPSKRTFRLPQLKTPFTGQLASTLLSLKSCTGWLTSTAPGSWMRKFQHEFYFG